MQRNDSQHIEKAIESKGKLLRGFRLSKFEVFNWGTFDREVHTFLSRGQTSLLVGENGAGKSTLIDAMLTLLVRPGVRNYNVAAGATKKERDERTYIRGAYDRTAGRDDKPKIQYLREGNGFYTAILATFASQSSGRAFTICQVMYLTSAGDKEIIYGFDESERSIAKDLAGLSCGAEIKSVMTERGFRVTENYKQYAAWMQRLTKFRSKAMDVFNQTVAVKDVQRLDDFIRGHMLEKKPWADKVSGLLKHFVELSEAHRCLVQVRQQSELLAPILNVGDQFKSISSSIDSLRRQQSALPLYFDVETQTLLRPLCKQWELRVEQIAQQIELVDQELSLRRAKESRLAQDIADSGGERLRHIPAQIEYEEGVAKVKRDARISLEAKLKRAGIDCPLTSAEQLCKMHARLAVRIDDLSEKKEADDKRFAEKQYELGHRKSELEKDRRELESLKLQKGNLPLAFIQIRDSLCQAFKLSPSDLPFVSELIAVAPDHRRWEASIEQVLATFARTLLVPDDLYAKVSGYIDANPLVDSEGRGQRLNYDRVTFDEHGIDSKDGSTTGGRLTLAQMLIYRSGHGLVPYVRAEILNRFSHEACETVAQFQSARGRAMTLHRHVKQNSRQHTKDDRGGANPRRHFVLGWDNKAKRLALEEAIALQAESLARLEAEVHSLRLATQHAATLLNLLEETKQTTEFDQIDDYRHEYAASQLRLEKQNLEASNDRVQQLRRQLAEVTAEIAGFQSDRDQSTRERALVERELADGTKHLKRVTTNLEQAKRDGLFESACEVFEAIESFLDKRVLTIETMLTLPAETSNRLVGQLVEAERRLEPIRDALVKSMSKLLQKFPVFEAELDPTPLSLVSFEALAARIAKDDLPRHERRFRTRLKNNVLQEIGLLHGSLENEREEIRGKIELLNEALHRLDWRTGTYMRLEPSDTHDQEIRDFRRDLAGCLEGTLDGTDEANETTFLRIEKLVSRLRDDANLRWRDKVIDVRNWFNFAAREFDRHTGDPGSYYDGGTGQSGGEKGKLAFLVLVAAIAYQYDLQPDEPDQDRFHFVMVDEMFSRSDDARAKYALDLFDRFGLQLVIVAPLDAKARVTEDYVGMYGHIVKDPDTHRSELICLTAEQYRAIQEEPLQ